ncbi:MAG: hypothetical protein AAF604_04395 [Acidobacteriota bacterium]
MNYHVGARSDYGIIKKEFGYHPEGQRHYAPPALIKSEKGVVFGDPEPDRIGTSRVERWNLSLRMGLKRTSRLTVAFSKCWDNHKAALALWIAYYNFCKRHRTVKMTPAMASEITRRPWTMRDLMAAGA